MRILATLLHQHLGDIQEEGTVFAVMPEHSLNSYHTHCNDKKADREKHTTWIHAIAGLILQEGESTGRISVWILCEFLGNTGRVGTFVETGKSEDKVSSCGQSVTVCKLVCLCVHKMYVLQNLSDPQNEKYFSRAAGTPQVAKQHRVQKNLQKEEK